MWQSDSHSSEVHYTNGQIPETVIIRPDDKLLTLSSFDDFKNELKPYLYGTKTNQTNRHRNTSVGVYTENKNLTRNNHLYTQRNPLKTVIPKKFPPYSLSTFHSPRTKSDVQNKNFLQKTPTVDFSLNFQKTPSPKIGHLRRSSSESKPFFGEDRLQHGNHLFLSTSNRLVKPENKFIFRNDGTSTAFGKDVTMKGLNGNCFIFEVEKHVEKPLVEKILKEGPMCFERITNEFNHKANINSNPSNLNVTMDDHKKTAFGVDRQSFMGPYSVAIGSSFTTDGNNKHAKFPVSIVPTVTPLYPTRFSQNNKSHVNSNLPFNVYAKSQLLKNQNDLSFPRSDIHRNDKLQTLSGCSYLTGEIGKFPLNNVRRGKESDTWNLHKSYAVILPSSNNVTDNTLDLMTEHDHMLLDSMYKSPNSNRKKHLSPYLSHDFLRPQKGEPQKLFCVRHGERVDSVFGSNWAEQAFDKNGCYQRTNLNMPSTLPRRRNPWKDFFGDSPLTEIGMMQARLTGEALRQRGIVIHYCYASPAFRCIQTAHNILLGMGIEKFIKIHIEPGIFEFLGWYDRGIPNLLTPEELVDCNFNIDLSYKPTIPLERLNADEKYLDYYNRSYKTTQNITERHKAEGGNILLSGHAATLEVCTRQICGFPPRSYQEFNHVIRKVSFLGLSFCERDKDGNWRLREPPIPHIQHTNNPLFDWKVIR